MAESIHVDSAAEQVESLLSGFPDAVTRARAQELVRLLMELYGAALNTILNVIRESGGGSEWLLERLADDKLVASLLLVHGLHPIDVDTRIRHALARIERYLDAHRLILAGVADGTARVRVVAKHESKSGAAPPSLASAIEQAVRQSAPEVERVEVEGITQPTALVQIGLAR